MTFLFFVLLALLQVVASATVKPPPSPEPKDHHEEAIFSEMNSVSDHEMFLNLTKGIKWKYNNGQLEEFDLNKMEEDFNVHRRMNGTDLHDDEDDDDHVIQPRGSYTMAPSSFLIMRYTKRCRRRSCADTFFSTTGFYVMCFIRRPRCFNPLTSSSPFLKINGINYCSNAVFAILNPIQSPLNLMVKTSRFNINSATCYIISLNESPATTTTTTTTTTIPPTTTTTTPITSTTTTTATPSTGVIESSTCTCGKLNQLTRIVGGKETDVHEYPHQVGLVSSSTSRNTYCGGSIIGKRWIVTAAHCTAGDTASNIYVLVGEHNRATSSETNEKVYGVSRLIQHPQYNPQSLDKDISLLELSEDIPFNSDNKVAPICLPTVSSLPSGEITTVTGWGTLFYGGSKSNVLMEVDVPIIERATCNTIMFNNISPNMICAGFSAGGKDSCQGDSGGPLVYKNGAAHELVGVVSWGFGCAQPNSPGVYADVMVLKSWILSQITTLNTCVRNTSK